MNDVANGVLADVPSGTWQIDISVEVEAFLNGDS